MLYLFLIFISFIISLVITPFIILFCQQRNILSNPQRYKFYTASKPLLGGISIFLGSFLPALCIIYFTKYPQKEIGYSLNEIHRITFYFTVSTLIVLISGIWADLKYARGRYHWIFIFLASVVVHLSGFKFELISNPFGEPIKVGSWGVLLTIFWIVIITNIIEIINFIEGLGSTLVLIFSSFLLYIVIKDNAVFVTILLSTFTGSLFGFLFYNIPPSKIIYGKSGIRFLGFIIATIILFAGRKVTTIAFFIFPTVIIIFFLVLMVISSLEKILILKSKDSMLDKDKR